MNSSGKARSTQEKWLSDLGVDFRPVKLFCRDGRIVMENHINDETVIGETVQMAMERLGAHAAVYPDAGRWLCISGAFSGSVAAFRHYPSQEAAEMVAIHRGR